MTYTIDINKAEARKILKELERRFSLECDGNCDTCQYRAVDQHGYRIDREPEEFCRLGRAIDCYRDRVSGARSKWR